MTIETHQTLATRPLRVPGALMGGRLLRACRSRVGRSRAETQEGTDLTRRFARGATPRPCRTIAALEMHVAQTHDASVEEAAT